MLPIAFCRRPNYQLTVSSWIEQRSYLPNTIRVLNASTEGQQYTALAEEMRDALDTLRPSRPTAASLEAEGFVKASATQLFSCGGVRLGFGSDGSLTTLEGTHAWAERAAWKVHIPVAERAGFRQF